MHINIARNRPLAPRVFLSRQGRGIPKPAIPKEGEEIMMRHREIAAAVILLIVLAAAVQSSVAEKIAAPVTSLRVYLFDCGLIKGEDPSAYGLKKDEVKNPDMVVPCYLVVHPKGTLMWDVGLIPDSAFKGDKPVIRSDGSETTSSPRPLLPQLAGLGYRPENITYVAFSHYHFDHTANANAFAGSTWLVHASERDAMFAASAEHQSAYNRLRTSKTVILPSTDYDVFGDGTIIIKSTPGHTPGHQVLALKLPKTGPVLIAGDLWHYAEERRAPTAPQYEANREQTIASRAAMEAYLKQSGAQLWIEHDPETFNRLKKAPDYIE
jgi:glyoxylase-like metal-dependent hydrolase (beta-lactamase superfamily II)